MASTWESYSELVNSGALATYGLGASAYQANSSSDPDPFISINLHKAFGYYTWKRRKIAIFDSQFAVNCANGFGNSYVHTDLSGKTYTIVSATGQVEPIIVLLILRTW